MSKPAKTSKTKSAKFSAVFLVNGKPAMLYPTKVEGKDVTVLHGARRQYWVRIEGNDEGYITARDVMNAVGRVETAESLKALRAMLHKF